MDRWQFEALTRLMASGVGTRRAATGALAAGLISVLAARLGLTGAVAKQTKRKRRPKRKPDGGLRSEGRHKKRKKQPKVPPEPPAQPEPQPQRCPASCADSGGQCCADGSCAPQGTCCSGQRRCGDGSCIARDLCCPGLKPCRDGSCVAIDTCCPNELAPVCGACQVATCQLGVMICAAVTVCTHGKQLNSQTCECECPGGSELLADGETCCPQDRTCTSTRAVKPRGAARTGKSVPTETTARKRPLSLQRRMPLVFAI